MDTLTDEQVTALIARVTDLQTTDEDGKLAALYLDAGWERCYHGDARFHFNVKIRNYRALRDAITNANLTDESESRIEERINAYHDQDIQWWWESEPEEFLADLDPPRTFSRMSRDGVYSCGRSGGYANCDGLNVYPEAMIRFAQFLGQAVDYFESADYAKELVERAIADDKAEQIAALASPRIERIEA